MISIVSVMRSKSSPNLPISSDLEIGKTSRPDPIDEYGVHKQGERESAALLHLTRINDQKMMICHFLQISGVNFLLCLTLCYVVLRCECGVSVSKI